MGGTRANVRRACPSTETSAATWQTPATATGVSSDSTAAAAGVSTAARQTRASSTSVPPSTSRHSHAAATGVTYSTSRSCTSGSDCGLRRPASRGLSRFGWRRRGSRRCGTLTTGIGWLLLVGLSVSDRPAQCNGEDDSHIQYIRNCLSQFHGCLQRNSVFLIPIHRTKARAQFHTPRTNFLLGRPRFARPLLICRYGRHPGLQHSAGVELHCLSRSRQAQIGLAARASQPIMRPRC